MKKINYLLLISLFSFQAISSEKEVRDAELEIESAPKTTDSPLKDKAWCLVYFEDSKEELFLVEGRPLKLTKEEGREFLLLRGKVLDSENKDIWPFKVLSSACSSDYEFANSELTKAKIKARENTTVIAEGENISSESSDEVLVSLTDSSESSDYSIRERIFSNKNKEKDTPVPVEPLVKTTVTETLGTKEEEVEVTVSTSTEKAIEINEKTPTVDRFEGIRKEDFFSKKEEPKAKLKSKSASNKKIKSIASPNTGTSTKGKNKDKAKNKLDPASIGEDYEKRKGSFFRLSK